MSARGLATDVILPVACTPWGVSYNAIKHNREITGQCERWKSSDLVIYLFILSFICLSMVVPRSGRRYNCQWITKHTHLDCRYFVDNPEASTLYLLHTDPVFSPENVNIVFLILEFTHFDIFVKIMNFSPAWKMRTIIHTNIYILEKKKHEISCVMMSMHFGPSFSNFCFFQENNFMHRI